LPCSTWGFNEKLGCKGTKYMQNWQKKALILQLFVGSLVTQLFID
jgi:hypothetical protein